MRMIMYDALQGMRKGAVVAYFSDICLEKAEKNSETRKSKNSGPDANRYLRNCDKYTRMHPTFSGLAAWSENCKWYSSLPLGGVVSLFCESV
jgi:hypothetical protein